MLHRNVIVIGLTRSEIEEGDKKKRKGKKKKGKERKGKGFETCILRWPFLNVLGLETIDETISRKEGGVRGALASGAPDTVSWTVRSFLRSSSWSTVSFLLSFNPSSPVEERAAGQAVTSASFNDHYWNFYLPLNWKLVVAYRVCLPLLFTLAAFFSFFIHIWCMQQHNNSLLLPPPSSLNFAPQNFLTYLNRLIQTRRTMRFNLIRGSKRVSNQYRYVIRFLQNQVKREASKFSYVDRKKEKKEKRGKSLDKFGSIAEACKSRCREFARERRTKRKTPQSELPRPLMHAAPLEWLSERNFTDICALPFGSSATLCLRARQYGVQEEHSVT